MFIFYKWLFSCMRYHKLISLRRYCFQAVYPSCYTSYFTNVNFTMCPRITLLNSLSPPPRSTVNEYVFMVQARGIQIRENVKNIGAQVLEQVVRGAYSVNGTGNNVHLYTCGCILNAELRGHKYSCHPGLKNKKRESCCP